MLCYVLHLTCDSYLGWSYIVALLESMKIIVLCLKKNRFFKNSFYVATAGFCSSANNVKYFNI